MKTLLSNAYVVTMDEDGMEYPDGWILVEDGFVEAVGSGSPPPAEHFENLGGALATPGLVNTHHHLFQTLTRTRAQQADLFTWLRELYPLWARIDYPAEYAAARSGLAELALAGCSTVFDHHYVFPEPDGIELLNAEITAAEELGVRLIAARGSMNLGESKGGLPPDELVEDDDEILHTTEEEEYCQGLFGCRPLEYLEQVGWLEHDVWCAHCVHLSNADVMRFGSAGTGVAHCPTSNMRLGAGIAPVQEMLASYVRVGLGVDGSASNERGDLLLETRQALLVARARGGPGAMTAREALRLATRGGAGVLGRDDIGSLEPGKCADIAVWSTAGLEFGGMDDPVAGLVLSAPPRVYSLYLGGEKVVHEGRVTGADEHEI